MTHVKINNIIYAAEITGRLHDHEWDDRESKAIKLEMPVDEANIIFVNGLSWSIVQENEIEVENFNEETGEIDGTKIIKNTEEYNNSEFTIAGDIIDHRNGYITVKMGKLTNEEYLEQELARTDEALIELYESIGG